MKKEKMLSSFLFFIFMFSLYDHYSMLCGVSIVFQILNKRGKYSLHSIRIRSTRICHSSAMIHVVPAKRLKSIESGRIFTC